MAYAILPINSWQDIDFPIIVRTTGVGIPTLETLVTGITAPQWQVGDTNQCEGQELIHGWKEGSEFQWHVHIVTNGTEATDKYVKFEVDWVYADVHGQLSELQKSTSVDLLIPKNTPDRTHIIFEIERVTIPAHIGCHIWAKLTRVASTGAAPTANPFCSMLQIHVQCDTVGSKQISQK